MRDKMLRPRKPLQIIEVKIGRGQLLSKQNDLSRMHREVLCHMKDCCQGGRFSPLYRIFLQQARRIKTAQHVVYVCHRRSEPGQQFIASDNSPLIKLSLTLTLVSCATQTADNPLARVP